jgi:Na+-transporting NADH:ubiquinone oxidoreductase subunit F
MITFLGSSIFVFTGTLLALVLSLIFAGNKLISNEEVVLSINKEKEIKVMPGGNLLSTLANHNIFIPSACGGGGTCAMCKCKVLKGGGDILATEKTHINRKDAKNFVRLACQVKIRESMDIQVPEEIFSIKTFTGTVTSNNNVSTFIKYLKFDIDNNEILNFKAGGYVQISVPPNVYNFKDFEIEEMYRSDWDKFNLWRYKAQVPSSIFRAYSMANHPAEGNRVALTIRIATPPPSNPSANPGQCSSYVFSLRKGDKIDFSGPYGEFFIKDSQREMMYIGGGAGMAPMRSHIFHLFHTLKTTRKVTFFYGARSKKENFFDNEFQDIEKKYSNFKQIIALSEPLKEDNWNGPIGFIHNIAHQTLMNHEDPTEVEYYLCGPPIMIDSVIDMLDNLGVDEEMIAYDKF